MPLRPPIPEKTLSEFMACVPPVLCRAMPKRVKGKGVCGRGRLAKIKTIVELVKGSGLSRRTVQRIVWRGDWDGIRVDVASKFIAGCGVNIFSKQEREYFAKLFDNEMPHLSRSHFNRLKKVMGLG
jgi:hypothetical protein